MARKAPIVSLDFLKSKLQPYFSDDSELDFPYDLPDKVQKDLEKINFDWENYEIGNANPGYDENPDWYKSLCNYPCGYEVLENKLPVLFVNAGGDWEMPICLIIYWDGKSLRGYIPEDGNVYNRKEKCAYGSEDKEENRLSDEEYETLNCEDPNIIRKDIINRIQIV